jgi:aminoglycoside phosphotransferase (APT) family kinase protein
MPDFWVQSGSLRFTVLRKSARYSTNPTSSRLEAMLEGQNDANGRMVTEPDPDGLAAMTAALSPDLRVSGIRRFAGSTMAVHLIELTDGASRRQVVLKRFPPQVGSHPEYEWDALCFAHGADLPAPRPLLYDGGGWFGGPAIVMTAMSGNPCLEPTELESWAAALADVLAKIHGAPHPLAASMRRPGIWDRWEPSGLTPGPRTKAVSGAIAELRTRDWVWSFCHCDFHPANVLFRDDDVVGVVDWTSAKLSPFLNDLGRLRCAAAIRPGGDAPDLIATAYAARTNKALDGLAYWDVLAGAITLQVGGRHPLYEMGNMPLDPGEVDLRATGFVDRALARINSGRSHA